ncbi:PREDICTED: gamma-interferon-inducible lysosomal thiol reductase, partial [Populus euphratica]|uniref:Gamma-interferon-inducible lysosomal thiol reductase n=1 Tax=Populus euphratica TaxID=75702 RepID=A0AAJ6U7V5_POPEU
FSSSSTTILPSNTDKVFLALYYESLCPYSANSIVSYLNKLVEDDELLSIVNLYLSPWGNAKFRGNDTFFCQHGPYECLLNTVEVCAVHAWPKLEDHFPFAYCVERLVYERKYPEWESCFKELGLDPRAVSECYTGGGYGDDLELKYAAETNAPEPPHNYVPWVVVDGQPLYEITWWNSGITLFFFWDYEDFITYLCKAYKDIATPKACSKPSGYSIQRPKAKSIPPVCYRDTIISTLLEQIKSAISLWMQYKAIRAASACVHLNSIYFPV